MFSGRVVGRNIISLHGAEGARGGLPSHLRNSQAKKPLEGPGSGLYFYREMAFMLFPFFVLNFC